MSPVLKYFVPEKDSPVYARFWSADAYPAGDADFDESKTLSFPQWCIKGTKNTNVVYEITTMAAGTTNPISGAENTAT